MIEDPSTTIKDGALSFARGSGWRTKGWAYMRYDDATEELYDMATDPQQFTNLAGREEHLATKRRLAAAMDAALGEGR